MLRDYQTDLYTSLFDAWKSHQNVLAVSPTGSGKTVIFASVARAFVENNIPVIVIAHRQELVGQISLTLARNGMKHKVIGGNGIITTCSRLHVMDGLNPMIDQRAKLIVAGVDTLIRKDDQIFSKIGLWINDEAHHLLDSNKWGTAIKKFPNAKGLGVTATPLRSDGKGLGRHASGVFDTMVLGPDMQNLIDRGFLTPFRIFAPPSATLHIDESWITGTGDFSHVKVADAIHKANITGDAVQHYLRHAAGKIGVSFCVDVAACDELANAYRAAGVPAEVVTADTPDILRQTLKQRLACGVVKMLINVDIFGEGYDLPAIEVVSFLRPTASYGLFVQQFGRALRPMEGKHEAIIIDHVGNTIRHGLPIQHKEWSLDDRAKRGKSESAVLIKVCQACTGVYERFRKICPFCGHEIVPTRRDGPEFVDGDLVELDTRALSGLHAEIKKVYAPPKIPHGASPAIAGALRKHHRIRIEALDTLKHAMLVWDTRQTGMTVSQSRRLFYALFGVDVLSAQALTTKEAIQLTERIESL